MRRVLAAFTTLVLLGLAPVALAEEGGENTVISSIQPSSGETTPGGTVSAVVTVDGGILSTCLTATSDNPLNITVTFDGLALSCGVGTWSSNMKVSVSTLIEPGLHAVHVHLVDPLGALLESRKWLLTVTSPTTTTTTTLITLPPTTLPQLTTTSSTTSTTTTTTLLPDLTSTTLPKLITTTTIPPTTTTTSSSSSDDDRETATTEFSTTTTIATGTGAGGGPTDTGGGSGEGTGDAGGSGEGSEGGASSQRTSGLLQSPVGLGADIPTDLFGSTAPEVLGFDIAPGFSDAVELIEASWIWVLALALLIAGALVKGIDRRVSPIPAGPDPAE